MRTELNLPVARFYLLNRQTNTKYSGLIACPYDWVTQTAEPKQNGKVLIGKGILITEAFKEPYITPIITDVLTETYDHELLTHAVVVAENGTVFEIGVDR